MSTDERAARNERNAVLDAVKAFVAAKTPTDCVMTSNELDLALSALVVGARDRQREEDAALADIEPELPGEMPDEMWEAIQGDRDAVGEALRIAVRQTKQNIATAVRATGNTEEE